jgi:acetylornithine deacetylase
MRDRAIELLRDLVAIDSVNPSLVPGAAGESAIAERIAAELRGCGFDVRVSDAAPGRTNVVALLEARQRGRALMLCGHSDTVGVEGMNAPFDLIERDGKLFGRGAQDMKGGVAAIVDAARTIAEGGLLRAGRLVVAIVADEEYASVGAEAMAGELRCDGAIVCEPTDLAVGIGHKGFEWAEVTTHGVAAHGSRPDDGVDAIVMMGRVLGELEQLERGLESRTPHPLLGRASVHASLISGGRELSTYPDRCTLAVERRTIDGEAEGILLVELNAILDRLRRDAKFRAEARQLFTRRPYLTPRDCELVQLIGRPTIATSFWTDAAILGAAGTPSVIFGPGGAGLHSIEEYVRIDEVLACRDALIDVAQRFCQASPAEL